MNSFEPHAAPDRCERSTQLQGSVTRLILTFELGPRLGRLELISAFDMRNVGKVLTPSTRRLLCIAMYAI